MRDLFAEQLEINSRETMANVMKHMSNRAVLARHVTGLFREEGGLSGFTAWATPIARDLSPPETQPSQSPVRLVRETDAEDMNVQDEPYEEPPAPLMPRAPVQMPAPPLPPPPPPPAAVDRELIDAIRALPGQIVMAIQQAMPRVVPMPPAPPPVPMPSFATPQPYANSAPPFAGGGRWPYNGR